jgi:hypothetical protein
MSVQELLQDTPRSGAVLDPATELGHEAVRYRQFAADASWINRIAIAAFALGVNTPSPP